MFYYVFYFLRGDLKMDKTIVKKFKEGDKNAALTVLHKYEPLINKYCLKTNLKGFDKNDLRQEANLSVLKALNAIDLNKDSITYDAYIMNTIRNTFNLLIRNHHKANLESSLNINVVGDYDIIDLLEDGIDLEELLISNSIHSTLKEALSTLSSEELEVLYLIFCKFKGKLRPYCLEKEITRYEGKKNLDLILSKLRKFFI